MIKKFTNWDNVKASTETLQLPVGGYVSKIMGAEIVTYHEKTLNEFSQLLVSIDISEGEYANYYAEDYRNQQWEDKKWRGIVRLYLPKEDGSDKDEWTKSTFKGFTDAVEDSNNGYHWDWNEQNLKGKTVGVLVRNEQWEYEGNSGWKTKPFKFISADLIKNNKYKTPKDKPLKNSYSTTDQSNGFTEMPLDEDLPF